MDREHLSLVGTWAILLALLAVTVAAVLLPIGPLKPVINLAAALGKAVLIYWVFMHLKEVNGFLRLAAVAAALWIVLLAGMLWTDIVSRV